MGMVWIVDWSRLAKLILFAAVMYGIYHLVHFLVFDVSWWMAVPWAAFWLLIAVWIDSRDRARQQRQELEDRQTEPWL